MTSHAAPNPPTTITEPYHVVESRIIQGVDILQQGGKPNFSAAAREFSVPLQRLRARWNGRRSKQEVVPWNRKLNEHEELAVCTYLDRLDKIGLHARLSMIANCTNGVLDAATRTGCSGFNKLEFFAALGIVREQTFKRTTFSLPFARLG